MSRLCAVLWLGVAVLGGCTAGRQASPPRTVTIVPGCPTLEDGRLSLCLWRRVIWASQLYEDGRATDFITSGSAVYNRYTEAVALKAGMTALGIPPERIHTETQALHTDENMGYSLALAQQLGFHRVAVASDRNQALGACVMVRRWGHDCLLMSLDRGRVHARRLQPLPQVRIPPVPASSWQTLEQRELAQAQAEGRRRRPRSLPYYVGRGLLGLFGLSGPPEPPRPEPTLTL